MSDAHPALPFAPPRLPCKQCLADPAAGAFLDPAGGRVFAVWCEHSEVGAVLTRLDSGDQWRTLGPISRDAFADYVLSGVNGAAALLAAAGMLDDERPAPPQ